MILSLKARSFRCYEHKVIDFSCKTNAITGHNGSGKTTILESIFYLSTTRSPRTHKDGELIKQGESEAELSCVLNNSRSLRTAIYPHARRVFLNECEIKAHREILGVLPSVFFSPDDMLLFKGEPSLRRRFIDITLCQTEPTYVKVLSKFKHMHKQKARLLNLINDNPSFEEVLPEVNFQFAELCSEISRCRRAFLAELQQKASVHHLHISGGREELTFVYDSKCEDLDETLRQFEFRRQNEIARRQCLIGSHLDDFTAYLNNSAVKATASRGQTRTAALSCKLAAREIIKNALNENPVLLLDDVLSELDDTRQEYLMQNVTGGQLLIAGCSLPNGIDVDNHIEL